MNPDQIRVYLAMDWPLFPCSSRNKKPLITGSFYNATTEQQQIAAWREQFPACAWGTPTSATRGVVDVDPRNGGLTSLHHLEAEHGRLPVTPKVKTGGGGFHFYLQFPPGTPCCVLASGIERKAIGGYVILPPCRIDDPLHDGREYTWEVNPWDVQLAFAPEWCSVNKQSSHHRQLLTHETGNPWVVQAYQDDFLSHPGSPEGERHTSLCRLVGLHLSRGDSDESIRRMAEEWSKRCSPPLDEWERPVLALIDKEAAKAIRGTTPPRSTSCRTLVSVSVDDSDSILVGREGENVPSTSQLPGLVPSLPDCQKQYGTPATGEECGSSTPKLESASYSGLFGEMLKAIAVETEAHPAGILLGWLCCFGTIVGRAAYLQIGPRTHHPALYVGVVGNTSDAKGDTWAASLYPFAKVDPTFVSACVANGIGSGEGLVERIADEYVSVNKATGVVERSPGASDKRCLLRLSELSRLFKVGRRENSTLSEYLREAWDGEPISVPNRSANALSTTGYSVSLVGDITPGVLQRLLATGTEAFDGMANRFLWCCVRSSCDLPSGGSIPAVLAPFHPRLADALSFGKQAGVISRDAEADRLWAASYPALKRSGDTVPHTDRARPYVLRLAVIYALADSSTVIRVEHLRAALAVWNYCRESARLLFAPQPAAAQQKAADPLWLRFLNAIQAQPGIARTALRDIAGHKVPAHSIEDVLLGLEHSGLVHRQQRHPAGGGRPAECWYPGCRPNDADSSDDNPLPPPASQVIPDVLNALGREGTNSSACLPGEGEETVRRETTVEGESSFPPSLPAQPEQQGQNEELGEEGVRVVNQETRSLIHEGCGSLALSGVPGTDSLIPTGTSCHRVGADLVTTEHFDAGNPPLVLPERLPREGDGDYFIRKLESLQSLTLDSP